MVSMPDVVQALCAGRGEDQAATEARGSGADHLQGARAFLEGMADHGPKCSILASDRDTSMVVSSVVTLKAVSHEFPARELEAFTSELELEHAPSVLNLDQQPATLDLGVASGRIRYQRSCGKEEFRWFRASDCFTGRFGRPWARGLVLTSQGSAFSGADLAGFSLQHGWTCTHFGLAPLLMWRREEGCMVQTCSPQRKVLSVPA